MYRVLQCSSQKKKKKLNGSYFSKHIVVHIKIDSLELT